MSDGGSLTRDVELRLKVTNQSQAGFKALTDQVQALTAAINQETEAAARGTIKQAELTESLNKLKTAGDGLKSLAGQIQIFKNLETEIDKQGQKIREAAAALDAHRTKMEQDNDTTQRTQKRLESLTGAYERATRSLAELENRQFSQSAKLKQAGVDTNNLAAVTAQLLGVVDQAGAGIKTLDGAVSNYTKNVRLHNEEVKRQSAITAEATKKEQDQAAALKAVADATERLNAERQKAGLAGVQTGTQALISQREAERKAEADFIASREKGIADLRNARMESVRKEVEENAKAREKAILDERARNEQIEKLRQQSLAGLTGINARHDTEQAERTRQGIEERNRRISNQNTVEREEARRTSLSVMGRFREDTQARIDGYKREREARQTVNAGRSAGSQIGLLGLPAYQVTNLGYQGVDIAQGFLSGVSPAIIAAQQGPQVLQIFGMAALKWSPIIVAAIAAIGTAWGALSRTFRETASEREFAGVLTQNSQAVGYAKDQLTALRKEARDMGMSWTEAGQSIKIAVEGNVRSDRLKEFLQTAQNISDATGKKVPDAMKELTTAFTGSAQELLKLNDSYHFLDREQSLHIHRLLEEGRTEQARAEALEKFSSVMAARAKEARSPWTDALRDISIAWDDLLLTISKTQTFQDASKWVLQLARDVRNLAKAVDDITQDKPGARQSLYDYILEQLFGSDWRAAKRLDEWAKDKLGLAPVATARIPALGSTATSATAADEGRATGARSTNEAAVRSFLEQRGYSGTAIAGIMGNISVESSFDTSARNATGHFGLAQWDKNRQAVLEGSTDLTRQMELLDKELTKLDPSFKKATDGASVMALRFEKVFERSGGQLNDKRITEAQRYAGPGVTAGPTSEQIRTGGEQVALLEKQRAIDTARTIELDKQARYRQAEAEINQKNIDDISKAAEIRFARAKIDQELFIKQQSLEQKREQEKITFARHYYEVVAAGEKDVREALEKQNLNWEQLESIRDRAQQREYTRLTQIDQQNKAFDAAVKTVDDLERSLNGAFGPNMENRLAGVRTRFEDIVKQFKELRASATLTEKGRIDELITRVQGLQPRAEFQERGNVLQEQAKDAVAARNDLVSSFKSLQEAGAISISEEQDKTRKAFELTKPAIDDAVKSLEEWLKTAEQMGVPAIAIEKTKAAITKLRVESEYIDPLWKGLVKTAEDSVGNRAAEAFDSIAEAIGGAIAKTKEWRDVWTSVRNAAANFFAGILKDLAQYIIKAELAKIMSSFIPSLGGLGAATAAGAAATGTASQIGAAGIGATATGGLSSGWTSIFSGAAAIAHQGGVIGTTQLPQRPVYWFGNAPRFHNGGLAANEQAAILQTGEEVLTANNPRHVNNYGGEINIRNVLVADPEFVSSHMASARGEKVIMSTLTRNAATVRQLVR